MLEWQEYSESLKSRIVDSGPYQRAWYFYQSLGTRDQLALRWLSLFLLIVLVYLAVIMPAYRYFEIQQAEYRSQLELSTWIDANRAALLESRQRSAARQPDQNLLSVASSTARSFQISLSRYQQLDDDRLLLTLENVPFNNLVLWLDTLESQYGVSVTEFSADRKEVGVVTVRLGLGG